MDNYDEIMHMIPCMNRPLEIQFSRIISISSSFKSSAVVDNRLAKVHESKSDSNLVVSATLSPKPSVLPSGIGVIRVSTNDGIADRYSNNNHASASATSSKVISNEIYVQKARKNIKADSEDDDDDDEDDGNEEETEESNDTSELATAQSVNNAQMSHASSTSSSIPCPVLSTLSIDHPPKEVMSWSPGTNRSMSPLAGTFEVSPVSSPERIIATRPASRTDMNHSSVESTSHNKPINGQVRFEERVGDGSTEIMEARSAESDVTTDKATGLMLEVKKIPLPSYHLHTQYSFDL